MATCPKCGAKLETPLGCSSCGVLFSPSTQPTPFEVFGLAPAFAVDATELKRRLLRFSRILHPDYFGAADAATRQLAERNSAMLNEAHDTLSDAATRADWLVRWLGGPGDSDKRDMPKSFLLEVLEWNETLETAREAAPGSSERAALDALEQTLRDRRATILAGVERLLTPLPERGSSKLADARAELNALRYLDKTLAEIAALRLDHATSR
jgi:molecular chaperone HscB